MMNVVISVCARSSIIVRAVLCKYYFRGQTNPHYQQRHQPQPNGTPLLLEWSQGKLEHLAKKKRFYKKNAHIFVKKRFYKKAHIFVAFHHFSGGGEDDRGWVKVADVPAMGPHLGEDNNSWEDF